MKILLLIPFFALFCLIESGNNFDGWNIEKTKDSITVQSRIIREERDGKMHKFLEYEATAVSALELNRFSAVLNNIDLHRFFLPDATKSKLLEKQKDGSYLIYYFFDASWPMPNYDCIFKMTKSEYPEEGKIAFHGVTEPDSHPLQNVSRIKYNEGSYTFEKQEDGKTLIHIKTKVAPVRDFPNWALSSYFPDGPADIVRSIIELAEKNP